MIEKDFDIPFIAGLALKEKQIQQNYRPIIAVHKWFARRPGSLFRGLLLSEFCPGPLHDAYYRANDLSGRHIADPFMGGGTPIIEANRVGCDVTGTDINPMAYWIVKQELAALDLDAYRQAAERLRVTLESQIGALYRTECRACGDKTAHVKYFLWVKGLSCQQCDRHVDLFPGYMVAAAGRHPRSVLVCAHCGELVEVANHRSPGTCPQCTRPLLLEGPAKRGRCVCSHCGVENRFPKRGTAPTHRLFAIEYHCPHCKPGHVGRFFKKPDTADVLRCQAAAERLAATETRFIPGEEIPRGDETNRLHRWGYRCYREMFNDRQLLGLELSARAIAEEKDGSIRGALATNLSDLLRYQNMLCRYDTRSLKSLDVFSVHGFPVGLVQCESNLLGIGAAGQRKSACVGSGGWANIVDKYQKAKAYCEAPFEVKQDGKSTRRVYLHGERIGTREGMSASADGPATSLQCRDAATIDVDGVQFDAVFTDPPYFGNVQYAELMDFCYVWLRKLVEPGDAAFAPDSTRTPGELTGNSDMGRGLEHFTEGLSSAFRRMATALKPGGPLAFTYHHNDLDAYYPIAVAILDAGLTCSASLPCPAEMGASIHISGTGSSIVDTVLVCRRHGVLRRKWLAASAEELAQLVQTDLASLREGGVSPTPGDMRCIAYGHIVRMAIWSLRRGWNVDLPVGARLQQVAGWCSSMGGWPAVEAYLAGTCAVDVAEEMPLFSMCEAADSYGGSDDEIPF